MPLTQSEQEARDIHLAHLDRRADTLLPQLIQLKATFAEACTTNRDYTRAHFLEALAAILAPDERDAAASAFTKKDIIVKGAMPFHSDKSGVTNEGVREEQAAKLKDIFERFYYFYEQFDHLAENPGDPPTLETDENTEGYQAQSKATQLFAQKAARIKEIASIIEVDLRKHQQRVLSLKYDLASPGRYEDAFHYDLIRGRNEQKLRAAEAALREKNYDALMQELEPLALHSELLQLKSDQARGWGREHDAARIISIQDRLAELPAQNIDLLKSWKRKEVLRDVKSMHRLKDTNLQALIEQVSNDAAKRALKLALISSQTRYEALSEALLILHWSIQFDLQEVALAILQMHPALLTQWRAGKWESALTLICRFNRVGLLDKILANSDHADALRESINERDTDNHTALYYAQTGKMIAYLQSLGADMTELSNPELLLQAAGYHSAFGSASEMFYDGTAWDAFIEHVSDWQVRDYQGNSVLHLMADVNNLVALLKVLGERDQALPDADSAAASAGKSNIRQLDINQQNHDGETALHLAVKNRNRDAALILIKYGAKLNIRDKDGLTPLDYAFINLNRYDHRGWGIQNRPEKSNAENEDIAITVRFLLTLAGGSRRLVLYRLNALMVSGDINANELLPLTRFFLAESAEYENELFDMPRDLQEELQRFSHNSALAYAVYDAIEGDHREALMEHFIGLVTHLADIKLQENDAYAEDALGLVLYDEEVAEERISHNEDSFQIEVRTLLRIATKKLKPGGISLHSKRQVYLDRLTAWLTTARPSDIVDWAKSFHQLLVNEELHGEHVPAISYSGTYHDRNYEAAARRTATFQDASKLARVAVPHKQQLDSTVIATTDGTVVADPMLAKLQKAVADAYSKYISANDTRTSGVASAVSSLFGSNSGSDAEKCQAFALLEKVRQCTALVDAASAVKEHFAGKDSSLFARTTVSERSLNTFLLRALAADDELKRFFNLTDVDLSTEQSRETARKCVGKAVVTAAPDSSVPTDSTAPSRQLRESIINLAHSDQNLMYGFSANLSNRLLQQALIARNLCDRNPDYIPAVEVSALYHYLKQSLAEADADLSWNHVELYWQLSSLQNTLADRFKQSNDARSIEAKTAARITSDDLASLEQALRRRIPDKFVRSAFEDRNHEFSPDIVKSIIRWCQQADEPISKKIFEVIRWISIQPESEKRKFALLQVIKGLKAEYVKAVDARGLETPLILLIFVRHLILNANQLLQPNEWRELIDDNLIFENPKKRELDDFYQSHLNCVLRLKLWNQAQDARLAQSFNKNQIQYLSFVLGDEAKGLNILFDSIDKANARLDPEQQRDAALLFMTHQANILQLIQIMGITNATRFLKSLVVQSALPLERFLASQPILSEEDAIVLKQYYQKLSTQKRRMVQAPQWQNIVKLAGIIAQIRNTDYHIGDHQSISLKAILQDSDSDADFVSPEAAIKALCKAILAPLAANDIADETALSKIDIEALLDRFSPAQLVNIFNATAKMTGDQYRAIFREMLRRDLGITTGSVTDFLHTDSTEGYGIAQHNHAIREQLEAQGLKPESILDYDGSHEFIYFPNNEVDDRRATAQGSLTVLWSYLDTLDEKMAPLTDGKLRKIKNDLKQLRQIISKETGSPNPVKLNSPAARDKIQALIRKLDSLADFPDQDFQIFSEHVKQQWQRVTQLLDSHGVSPAASQTKAKRFVVKMWDKNAANTFFLGDYVGCCLAPDGQMFPAMVQRRMDDAMLFPVVIDPETNEPVALLWLYLAEDPDGNIHPLANFCEVKAGYGQNKDLRKVLLNALLTFCGDKYCQDNPGLGGLLMNKLTYGYNMGDLDSHAMQSIANIKKVGGAFIPANDFNNERQDNPTTDTVCSNYFLPSLNETTFHRYDQKNLTSAERSRHQDVHDFAIQKLQELMMHASEDDNIANHHGADQADAEKDSVRAQMKDSVQPTLVDMFSAFYKTSDARDFVAANIDDWLDKVEFPANTNTSRSLST
jgi:Ankyrin repeats (many copies)